MNRKNKRKFLHASLMIVALLIVYLILPLTLMKIRDRPTPYHPDRILQSEIREDTEGMSAEEIRNYSVKKTAKILSFTVKNNLPEFTIINFISPDKRTLQFKEPISKEAYKALDKKITL